jgi:ATP-dependent RNA helicase DeaD
LRDDRRERREARNARDGDSHAATSSRRKKPGFRHSLAEGSVWFRLSVGRRKNAEARWLLPMICRRGSIDKHDIGAIRIYATHTEFEISGQAADQFSANIGRPDKEENIRIEALPAGPQGEAPSEQHADRAGSDGKAYEGKPDLMPGHAPRQSDEPRHEQRHKRHREASGGGLPRSGNMPGSDKRQWHEHKAADAGRPRRHHAAPFAKPAFGKKPKKNKYRR